jgi:hypothetical protein
MADSSKNDKSISCHVGFTCEKYYDAKISATKELFEAQLGEIEQKTRLAKEGMELRFSSVVEAFDLRIREIDAKTQLAKDSMELRMAAANEIRGAMSDASAKNVTKEEFKSELKIINAEIKILRDFMIGVKAMATQRSMYAAMVLGCIGIILSAIAIVLHK